MDMQLSSHDVNWLIWGAALFFGMLSYFAYRNKSLLTNLTNKVATMSVELKKANHHLTILMNKIVEDDDIDETKLYIGNIDYGASENELAAHFSKYGQIETVNIPVDRYTGRARGFGFITFKTVEDAIKAMDLDGSEFKGRQIQVNFARERASA